jgi:uracil-DNA glycosylase
MSTIDLKDIQQKLYEKLKPSGWADKLKGYLLSDEFYQVLETLYNEANEGHRFTPVLKDLFRAFEECPYDQLKVVVVGQDPYPKANAADGIAFSCSKNGVMQASLRYIFSDLKETIDPEYVENIDLKRWSNQGVLMLNTALTTRIGKIGMHIELWRPFMNYLFDMLNSYNPGTLYVFMGNKAKAWKDHVNKNNFKFFTTHPASAAYTGKRRWDSGDVFNKVNQVLKEYHNTEIVW